MGDHTELMEKRDQLRREIAAGRDKTLPARIFNTTGRMISMITHRRQLVSWIYSASVLALIILLSELLVVGLFDVTPVWSLIWIASLEQGFIAMILAHSFMDNRLPDMLYHLTDVIQSVDDLVDLRRWLADVWSVRRCLAFVMLFSVTWCLFSATIGSSLYPSELAGLGPVLGILGALAYGIVIGIAIYYVLEFLRLPARISRYHCGLYEFAPINSEIISHLSRTFNYAAFVISVVAAVGTLIVALMRTPVLSVGVILLGWVPLTILFVSSQRALRKIVTTARWTTLNDLQARIGQLRIEADLAEKETVDAIIRLMDLHDRIWTTRNSALDLRAGLLFLNQLVLPVLVFIIDDLFTSIASHP